MTIWFTTSASHNRWPTDWLLSVPLGRAAHTKITNCRKVERLATFVQAFWKCLQVSALSCSREFTTTFITTLFCRIERWRVALKRSDVLNVPASKLRRRVVCSEHFRDEDYYCAERRYIDSRLVDGAVSSLFTHSNVPRICLKRKPPTPRPASVPCKKRKNATIVHSTENSTTAESHAQLLNRVGRRPVPLLASTYRSRLCRLNLRYRRTVLQLKTETTFTVNLSVGFFQDALICCW